MAVIYSDSDTYCVPFASNEELFGLKNLKVYTAENLMNLLIRRYDESKLLEESDALIKLRKKKKTTV